MGFSKENKPTRDSVIGVRFTSEQVEMLDAIAGEIGLDRVEVIRRAIDFWIENEPVAKRAARKFNKAND